MIHIAINHLRRTDWLVLQVRQIRRLTPEPNRIVACVEDIPRSELPDLDAVVESVGGDHAGKLNLLGHEIVRTAQDDSDTIVFLGPTALPCARGWFAPCRSGPQLTSVRDTTMYPAKQPHPAFCTTSVGVWRGLPGDWASGFVDPDDAPAVSAPGANLRYRLDRTGTAWDAHAAIDPDPERPLTYGVYGGAVYIHHAFMRRYGAALAGLGQSDNSEDVARAAKAELERDERALDTFAQPDARP